VFLGKNYIAIIVLFFANLAANAQLDLNKVKDFLDFIQLKSTEYIQVNENFLSVKPYYHFPGIKMKLKNDEGNSFRYKPNVRDNLGISITHRGATISTSLQMPIRTSLVDKYGSTRSTYIDANVISRSGHWAFDFQKYSGFYSSSELLLIPNEKYKRRDMKTMTFGLSAYLLSSGKVSLAASMNQSEKQLKSAGSFVVGFTERLFNIKADSCFIPYEKLDQYDHIDDISKGLYNSLALKPGYTYTYVYQDYFVSGMICLGPAIVFASNMIYTKSKRHTYIKPSITSSFKLIAGVHMNNLFGNIMWEAENNNFPVKDEKIKSLYQSFKIGVGLKL
jgi:hypothetical protein